MASSLLLLFSNPTFCQEATENELVGSYLFRFEWGGTRITLKSDSTFVEKSGTCTSVFTESGSFSFSEGVLHLTTLKITTRGYGKNDKEIDLRQRKARKRILDTDEPFKPEQHELQVVRWGERIYLMDIRAFESFIDAINLGFEPRQVEGYRAWYGQIFLREGDENKAVVGRPTLPAQFLSLLLTEPIVATVSQVETIDKQTVVTLNRGSADGLREGMAFVSASGGESLSFQGFWILSVTEHSAKMHGFEGVQVGDQFATRISDVLRYSHLRPLRHDPYAPENVLARRDITTQQYKSALELRAGFAK